MEASDEPVLSIATARPGVLVRAPASSPTMLGVSRWNRYFIATAVSDAEPMIMAVRMISTFPLLLKELKKPGPACMPIVKMKSTRPRSPNSLGITTPKCPKARATNITADMSSDRPRILILPSMKPSAIITNSAKYGDCKSSANIVCSVVVRGRNQSVAYFLPYSSICPR